MNHTCFDDFHPIVPALYFAFLIVMCMAAFQPVLVCVSLIGALCMNARLRGLRALGSTLRWQVPLFVLIMILNPVFSASGSTLLFQLGPIVIYAESLAYGACMAAMMIAAMLMFSNAAHVLRFDKVAALTGARIPVIGLMITMVARLFPLFAQRGRLIANVAQANSAAGMNSKTTASRARHVTVLMGWGMEDSLETADAMRARGWGAATKRTSYSRVKFGVRDLVALLVLLALMVLTAAVAGVVCSQSQFYPQIIVSPWCWLAAVLYSVILMVPAILEVALWIKWR